MSSSFPFRAVRAAWALLWLALAGAAVAQAPVAQAPLAPVEGEVIVRFKAGAGVLRSHPLAGRENAATVRDMMTRRAGALGTRAGRALEAGQATGERTQVMRAAGIDAAALARRLAADPDVEWAEPNGRRRIQVAPNDPLYAATAPGVRPSGPDSGQWYLRAPTPGVVSAIDIEAAWLRTQGSANVVVAVLDTGVRFDHPDLGRVATGGRLLPGYDFVTNATVGNDGDGRDPDPSDPGDWVSTAEAGRGTFTGCTASNSSWHGTRTASLVGAATNNGLGMAGTAPGVSVLPVRVLGKCFGTDGDIQAGMLWAAGISVPGVPDNPNPARVLNMSLGASGACTAAYQSVVDQVLARGAVIVAAAGNSAGGPVGTPGNCNGVIAVLALRHAGTKVGFSDLGAQISIAAPGGNCINVAPGTPCLYPILAASNTGTTVPVASDPFWTDSFRISVGTSFSSPLVAGTVGLMFSAQPTLTPTQVRTALQSTARPFPTTGGDNGPDDPTPVLQCTAPNANVQQLQCYCNTTFCGAGMLDAGAAVAAVAGPVARIDFTPAAPVAGTAVQLSGSGSSVASGRSVVAWSWTLVDGGGIATAFSSATNAATAALTPSAAGSLVVRLTVTDDLGARASVNQTIAVAAVAPPVVAPPAATGGGGGGGAVTLPWMLLLALATALLWRAPAGAVSAPARRV
jgi:serine protease